MRFAVLGSGSRGNAVLIRAGDEVILLDCGFALRELRQRIESLGEDLGRLSAVLVTHEHGDHCRGIGALARRYQVPVYMTPGTYMSREFGVLPQLHLIEGYQPFTIGSATVTPVAVPHDAREPSQFIFNYNDLTLGVLTDLGCVTAHVLSAYRHCDGLILEANHDPDLLATGPYPPSLKRRVASDWGHLSNAQSREFLNMVQAQKIRQLVIAHVSEKNNDLSLLRDLFNPAQNITGGEIHIASQDQVSPWFDLVCDAKLESVVVS